METAVNALATLAAAFAGAWAAFALQREHEGKKIKAAQVEECNRALLILTQQANFVLTYCEQILEPYRDNPARHLLMPPTGQLDYSHLVTNAASLAFLLQTEAEEVPQMIALANDRFHRFVAAINDRARVHHEFQAAIEASPIDMEAGAPVAEIELAIGLRLTRLLKTGTDGVFMLAGDTRESHVALGRDIAPVLRTVFPSDKIVSFKPA